MNAAATRKLETIVGKLEALQNSNGSFNTNDALFSQEEIDAMRSAKSALLRILK